MKICWITLCFNEIDILPFVRRYWERVADRVIVYDNGSTDGSLEYLSALPYVEVRHFDTVGQNDVVQKLIKEQAYLEARKDFDIVIITDMDEVFWIEREEIEKKLKVGFDVLICPIYSLCEDFKPEVDDKLFLHQQCHKFYRQRMNHMKGLDRYSKLSIFNTKTVERVGMSVGQHYVQTLPKMNLTVADDAFCLHIDKGFGNEYKWEVRQRMNKNLSDVNKRGGMCVEYGMSYEALKNEYEKNQQNCFDINKIL